MDDFAMKIELKIVRGGFLEVQVEPLVVFVKMKEPGQLRQSFSEEPEQVLQTWWH